MSTKYQLVSDNGDGFKSTVWDYSRPQVEVTSAIDTARREVGEHIHSIAPATTTYTVVEVVEEVLHDIEEVVHEAEDFVEDLLHSGFSGL